MTSARMLALATLVGLGVMSAGWPLSPPGGARAQSREVQEFSDFNPGYDGRFQFVRLQFRVDGRGRGFGFGRGRGGQPPWMHDYPRAERNFLRILDETTFIHPHLDESNILTADDPELLKFPVAYIVEVGFWQPTDAEAQALGDYLRKGGFLIVDDFRSPWEMQNFAFQMQRVLPGMQLIELDASHEIFDSFFRIETLDLAPPTYTQFKPVYYGVFEDNDQDKRLMAIVNHNNDVAEYWEWSSQGYFPIDLSNEAYKLGVNYVVYAMTH